ncbi:MAG: sodium:glutamate symporter, partial [Corynebacterium casei]|nr:sodium:glutamate symporter [Corynebacterium casei]
MAYVGFGPFEIGMTVIAPIAVVYGMTAGLGWLSVLLAVGIYLLAKFGGWMPPRGTIFAQGIGHGGEKAPKS